jgi:hypothetical protein
MPNVKARSSKEIQKTNDKEKRGRRNDGAPHFDIPLTFGF